MNTADRQQLKELFHSAVEIAPPEREAFLKANCAENVELYSEVSALLTAHESAGDFIQQPVLVDVGLVAADEIDRSAAVTGQQIGSYKVIRELGRGGMGAVYLAARADESFDRNVALKLIKRGMDSDAIIKRFVMERQILANLDHPNIARLIDGGTTEDGLPYFVMEYVEGQTIKEYCDIHRLTTIARLKLFRTVLSAVHFAHQNLLVHRDIKPANILVTVDGTPKLLDFGVAKLLSPNVHVGEITEATSLAMTPEYASPEQARGETITTASDVYSLGVLLYELLTGHRPYRFSSLSMVEMIDAICTQAPAKPSTAIGRNETSPVAGGSTGVTVTPDAVNRARVSEPHRLRRELEGDLDNIVLKAMRKEPQRRYASVEQFSEDIQRHLEGLPVSAVADSVSYRFGKFVKRHRAGVFTSGLVVLMLVFATAMTSWQAVVASRQRVKAERRFDEIRKLSNSLITEVQTSLVPIPGTSPTQRLLAQKSLDYLDSLAQDEDKDVGVLGELASAYLSVGHLQVWTLQDNAGALLRYQKAVEIQRKRILLAPDDATMKKDLTFGLFKLSEALEGFGRQEELFQVCGEQIELLKTLLATDPANEVLVNGIAGSYQRRGELLGSFKRSEESTADFCSALASIKQLINLTKETARDPQARVNLSFSYIQQGTAFTSLGEWQNAAESYQTAGQIAEAVYRENPELTQALRNTSASHNRRGDALDKLGDYRGALENYRYSLKVVTEGRARNPNSSEMLYGEAKYTVKVGIALHKVGELHDSFDLVRKGLGLSRQYISEDRNVSATITYGVEEFQQSAEFFAGAGQREEAIAVYQEALRILDRLAAETSERSGVWRLIARYDTAVGDLYASYDSETKVIKTTNHKTLLEARRWYQQGFDNMEKCTTTGTLSLPIQTDLDEVLQKLLACDAALAKSKG